MTSQNSDTKSCLYAAAFAGALLLTVVLTGVVVLSSALGVKGLVANEVPLKENSLGTPELNALNETDWKALNSYRWVDKDSLKVSLPIERAIELLISEAAADTNVTDTTGTEKNDE